VDRRSWRLVPLADIPSEPARPDDPALAAARAEAEHGGHPAFAGYPAPSPTWHAVRTVFRITAFGVAAAEAARGEALIWPHTEAHYGHEELYLVLEGRARFLFDDDSEVEVGPHDLLYVKPKVGRGAIALETPTKLFIVGGRPGVYDPPPWASDWRPGS
jgi:mannose-6-phosphate isomerase-like protein (cupin superfamily)